MEIDATGNIGIGCTPQSDARLTVNGVVKAKKVNVTLSGFPDYVFKPDYKLQSLSEVEAFIQAHGHLPEVPTEQQVLENGLDVGDTQALLMKKVEELTLYIIKMEKRIAELEKGGK
ncbi:MAG: hypothetical protein SNJ71_05745 [Bacteroidales bacterium]